MTAYTSTATGNWSAGATWVGGVAPPTGAGHTATIANAHTVTVDVNWDIGSSPPGAGGGTAAITVTGTTGKLVLGTGITLTARGDITVNTGSGGQLTMNAGAILEFDASAATTPLSQNYRLNLGGGNACVMTVNGTTGSHCQIRSNVGGGNAYLRNAASTVYNLTATYCDFTRMGTASLACIETGYQTVDLQHCLFDACGKIELRGEGATFVSRLVNVTMKNTVASSCLGTNGSATALSSGTRALTGCVFDKLVTFEWRNYTVTDTLFNGTVQPISGTAANQWAAFTGNLLVAGGSTESTLNGSVTDCYYLSNHATTNPHSLFPSGAVGSMSITGCVFECTGTASDGDCVSPPSPATPCTYTMEGNIGLPNGGGTGYAGTLFSASGNANVTLIARHNTWVGTAGQACCVVGETYAGHAGLLAEFRDNLFWDTSIRTYKLHRILTTVPDLVTAANCHHNAGYLMAAGTNGGGYNNLAFSSGSPGANDVDGVDPVFVDKTRNIAKWDLSLGGPGTTANALIELKKKNEAGYNATYSIAALVTYVKAGFMPQAAALRAASDSVAPSNGWIGAVPGVSTAVDHSRLMLLGVGA